MDLTTLLILGVLLLGGFLALVGVIFFLLRRPRPAGEAEAKPAKKKPEKAGGQPASFKQLSPERAEANGKSPSGGPAQVSSPPARAAAQTIPSAKPASGGSKADNRERTGQEIRILIVDDNPGTRENVSRLLYFEDELEVIGQAINGRQGLEMAIELKPHIVLMDINMPDMDGITATHEMSVKAPYSQVIIMSVQADHHYMKQAMAAGARDFQPKPFTAEELVNCIRRVYKIGLPTYQQLEAAEKVKAQQANQPAEMAKEAGEIESPVIAVYSPKGGVGTSAIAANLAVALQQAQGDVVLMDSDLQFGDILVHLNTKPNRTISDLIQQDQFEVDLLSDVLLPHESGLKLLLAPPQPELADIISPHIVTEVIGGLKKQFKMVVVDTNKGLKETTLNVLEAATCVLVVINPELPAIKSAKLFLEVAEQLEFDHERLLVVINQADKPGGIKPEKIRDVLKISESYRIPYDPKLHFALSKGQSICQQDSSAPSARAIMGMAQQLWQRFAATQAVEEVV
jgi:pilus assembly protein CpaE